MVKLLNLGTQSDTPYPQYVCDTETDLENCHKEFGAIAICLDTKAIYICSSELEWVNMSED